MRRSWNFQNNHLFIFNIQQIEMKMYFGAKKS